jgi:hypothetical protein
MVQIVIARMNGKWCRPGKEGWKCEYYKAALIYQK